MRAVAIVAFGRFSRTQLRYFAVERIEIRFRNLSMTFAALIENALPEIINIYALNGVRQMAVIASGQFFVGFGDQRTVHAAFVLLVNTEVAIRACLRNVVRIHRRIRIAGRQLAMTGVAVDAGRRHHQTAL